MNKHIVHFEHCNTCKYMKRKEIDDPCDECLNNPINEDTRYPINYKEDTENVNKKGRTTVR